MGHVKEVFRILNNPLHKNATFLMINTLGVAGLGFIFWMIVARLFPSDEVGVASAIISSMSLLGLLATFGFHIGMIRFLPKTEGIESSNMINSCFTISGIFSLIFGTIFIIGLDIWSPSLTFIKNSPLFFLFFLLFILVWTLSSLSEAVFISKRATRYIFIKNVLIFSVIKLPLPFILISFGAFGIFSSWGVAIIVAFIISLILLIPSVQKNYKPNITIKKEVISPIFHFSLGNYFARIFANISPLVLPLIIINMLSAESAGYFYMSWMIISLLFMIPTAISTSFLAESSIDESLFHGNLKKSITFTLYLLIPAMFVLYFFGDWILLLIGNEYSKNATPLLRLFILSVIPLTINIFYVTIKRIEKRVGAIILLYGITSFFTLGLSYYFIPIMGLSGVGIGWLIAQCIALIVVFKDWLQVRLLMNDK